MGGFSKVTNFLKTNLFVPESNSRPQNEVAEILNEDLDGMEGMAINNQEEPGFEVITKVGYLVRCLGTVGIK